MATSLMKSLRLRPGKVSLDDYDTDATPGFDGGKKDGKAALSALGGPLSALQERLFAEAAAGGRRSVLLVLQGLDTSGKGGVIRHCAGLLDPQGVSIASFKRPTEEELRHDFLWRIENRAPASGMVGIFDRSHYEDVLVTRVHKLAATKELNRRYAAINAFEQRLGDSGTTVVKCFLHISKDKQKERLLARLDNPAKVWKYNPGDLDERKLWSKYQRAFEVALERCNTAHAPWFVVPSDRKWYRNWAIATLLLEHLAAMKPTWPGADFDVEEEHRRVGES
jgi:PPK2 family polyphosphate:nucleotide phosphotransferase